MGQFHKPEPLTPTEKSNWNNFIDFVEMQKMKGNPALDQRNKQIGMSLLQKFNFANPKMALDTNIVPKVQQELQDYRSNLVNQWKAGKVAPIEGVKTEDDIMNGISQVDGWPGTKTLASKFPVATATNSDGTKKSYGTDTQSYDKDRGLSTEK